MSDDKLVWVDVETTNLDPVDGLLLEVGFYVTNLDLEIEDDFSTVVGHPGKMVEQAFREAPDLVQKMHRDNNLWNELEEAPLVDEVDAQLAGWITEAGIVGCPLAGASLGQVDRPFLKYFLPAAYSLFHYRSIDVSSIKELCRKYNPELFKHVPEKETDHRVNTCLNGTLAEFKFYKDNFLFDGRE